VSPQRDGQCQYAFGGEAPDRPTGLWEVRPSAHIDAASPQDCTHWLGHRVDDVVANFEFAFPGVKIASSVVTSAESFEATTV
jgi:hypothetical protein